jgi:hypothetical protein
VEADTDTTHDADEEISVIGEIAEAGGPNIE